MRMKFIINGQTIRCVTQSNIAAGTSNYVGADFQFMTGEWDGLVKWATFIGDDGGVHRFALVNDSVNESATKGLNLTAGSWSCYVYGDEIVSGEIAKRITTTECHFNVNAVSELSEITTMPTEFETLMALAEGIKSEVSVMKAEVNIAKGEAESAAEDSEDSAEDSEAWAVGQRGGVDVPSTDETYHNNSKYYSGLYKPIVGTSAPTTSTVGVVGQFYIYGTNIYVCTAASTTYTWTLVNPAVLWGNINGSISSQTDLNTRLTSLETDSHTHSNKALLDTYTQTEANIADAVTNKHTHSNKALLDTIPSSGTTGSVLKKTASGTEWGTAPSSVSIGTTTFTLTAAGWSSSSQTVTVTGVTASNIVVVCPAPASCLEYDTDKILFTAQAANSVTFTCTTTPTVDITMNAMIIEA